MTKKEISEIENVLNEYSFMKMLHLKNGSIEDFDAYFAKEFAVCKLLSILGYRTRLERKAEREGITYNHYKAEKWS